jgi:single-strand DNA-binding protein
MYLNKVFLYGNLTRDPEVRALPSGQQVASFALATNRTYKDKDGAKQEQVEFHNVVAFGRTAEVIAQYLKKGKAVFVEGRIQTRSWDDKTSGEKKYRTEIVIDNFQFGPSVPGVGGAGGDRPAFQKAPATKGGAGKKDEDEVQYPEETVSADDIPF